VSIDVTRLHDLVESWTISAPTSPRRGCARQLAAILRADAWNQRHPVGVDVVVERVRGRAETRFATKTRSEAFTHKLGEHASIMLEGVAGSYSLDHVRPAAGEDFAPARNCLHGGACSAGSRWACTQHDALTSREGFERPQWRCACGPCHEAEGAERVGAS